MPKKPIHIEPENKIPIRQQDESGEKNTEICPKELKESYERLTDHAGLTIFKVKAEGGHVLYLNPTAERIFGYSKKEWLDDPELGLKIIHPDYQEKQAQIINQINVSKKPIKNTELGWLTKDGRKVILKHNIIPVLNEKADIVYFESIGYEITEQKKAEEALLESESRYHIFFDKGPDGVVILDPETARPINFNDQACQQLGYSREEFRQLRLSDIDSMETSEETRTHIRKVFDTGYENFNTRQRTKQGEIRDVNVTAQIIESGGNKIYHCIWRDITEQIQAEKKIRFQAKLLQSVGQSVIATDIENKITYWNEAAEQLFGWTSEEVIGRDVIEKIAVPGDEDIAKKIINTVYSGKRWSDELRIKRKNGDILPVFHTVTPLFDEKSKLIGLIGVSTDLSQIKKMESQIRNAQKMESIGNLAGGIAHDFNNILFPIIGMAELLLEDFPPATPVYESAQEILKAALRGSDLVKHILAFSRQSEHKMIPLRVQQILKEILKLIRATIPSYIEIKQDIQKDCGLIMADPIQIHQIAMNIITNAYHAVEDKGGTISITLKQISLGESDVADTCLQPGQYVFLSISDTGYGISPQLIDKIFDPYFTTKEQGRGTGIGLAIVYGIIKEHKGDIRVCSDLGKGSTFNIYFPLIKDLKGEKSHIIPEACQTGNEKILLVDDEEPIAKTQKKILERLGYEVESHLHSDGAFEAFKACPYSFDLVITDMTMPVLTGKELAKKILSIRSDVPIIICTGFSEKMNEEEIKKTGIKGFLMKPVVKNELIKTVRKLLDQSH